MSKSFKKLSDGFAASVAQANASIVRVEARRRLPATGIIWSTDGIIVTANHIVQQNDKIKVGLPDGNAVPAKLIGRDPTTDLALLQVEETGLTSFERAEQADLGVGQLVLALGRPGKTVQATLGVVSALGGAWRTHLGGQIDYYFQTDVTMYPGFSGGPLIGANATLLGLNSSALSHGASLTIPNETITRVAAALQAHGHMRRGYLGVSTQRARLPKSLREEVGQKSGLLIVSVEANSPAEEAGLTLGDTLVAIEDVPINKHHDLLTLLNDDKIGQKTPITIYRGGKLETLQVKIGERPSQ